MNIRTTQDERNQHVVIITLNGASKIYLRHHSIHVAAQAAQSLRSDVARHGVECIDFGGLNPVQYRTTKAGRRLLVAA